MNIKRKNPCEKTESQNIKKHKCNYCSKILSTNSNLHKHIDKWCKIKKQQDDQKEKIFQQLLSKMEEIEQQNKELKNEIKNTTMNNKNFGKKYTNNSNNTNNTMDCSMNNNTINIQLIAYGKENYDQLSEKEYQVIINKGFKSIQELVKNLHFNKNRPQNYDFVVS